MTATALDVSVGSALVLDGDEWRVERGEPHTGRVHLVALDGTRQSVTYRFLAHHPDCHSSSVTAAEGASRSRQPKSLGDLTPRQLELVKVRLEHLAEVRTGFRSGDRLRPGPGEPKPQYNPDTSTVTSRRHAKVAELQAMGRQEARLLALDQVGLRTLIRWEKQFQRDGIIGCADDRWLRESGSHRKVNKEVREAIHAVRQETKHLSKVSMTTKVRLITQYMHETFGTAPEDVPSYAVLRRVWHEWFGSGRGRQRNQQGDDLVSNDGYVLIDRPGKVVALDTTVLPVMVRESVFDEAVKVHLTLALCTYTHSICAFRLTLVSDTSVDVAMGSASGMADPKSDLGRDDGQNPQRTDHDLSLRTRAVHDQGGEDPRLSSGLDSGDTGAQDARSTDEQVQGRAHAARRSPNLASLHRLRSLPRRPTVHRPPADILRGGSAPDRPRYAGPVIRSVGAGNGCRRIWAALGDQGARKCR
ncbi:hypothetical protein WBG99_03250 [Streptomyces sp. TG1A-60]|uniref:hypothetical protein n=1 Tax=Streptomyces sp. TG1A-60 TaxID=3129111 RepID=UPI0030CEE42C